MLFIPSLTALVILVFIAFTIPFQFFLARRQKNRKLHSTKTSTHFGGRKLIAWFNTEMPFQEGPYKFRGLPGLIFEIYDSENIFHYTLQKSKNLSKTFKADGFLDTHYGKKPIPITLIQYHKMKLDYYNNIIEILNKYREKGVSIASEHDLNSKEEKIKKKKRIAK